MKPDVKLYSSDQIGLVREPFHISAAISGNNVFDDTISAYFIKLATMHYNYISQMNKFELFQKESAYLKS